MLLKPTALGRLFWRMYAVCACTKEQKIPTHLTFREKVLLIHLARLRQGRIYVEIGSYLGASACFIVRGMQRPEARLYCVDTWMNDAMTDSRQDTYQGFIENTAAYRDRIIPVRTRSDKAVDTVAEAVDFLFIDGDHSFEGVSNDIHAWFPRLAPGAVVVFHDYSWAEGVQRAVAELVKPLEATPGHVLDNTYWTIIRSW
jgi:predicted O-methyltransferase YrrM